MTQLLGVGAYTPAAAITSEAIAEAWGRHAAAGIEQVAVPEADEDVLTMAWEAATRALSAAGREPAAVTHLALATTTPPIEEEDLTVRLGSMLGVPAEARRHVVGGSSRGGTDALLGAHEADLSRDGVALVVAADAPNGSPADEFGQAAGAGSGAIVIGTDGPGQIEATAHHAVAAPGERYRRPDTSASTGLGVTGYDRRIFREAVTAAVSAVRDDIGGVDAVALHARDGKRPYRLAGPLGVDTEAIARGTVVHDVGYTATAGVFLGLADALEQGAERVLMVGYGAGAGADAILIDGADVPVAASIEPATTIDYPTYLRRIGALGGEEPAGGGAYVSMPTWQQSLPQRHRLKAGRCVACGRLMFPPDGACPSCNATDGCEPVSLPGTGTVETVTDIAGGAPPEFEDYQTRAGPFQTAIVALDGPEEETVSVPLLVTGETAIEVSDTIETVVRRIYTQEGLPRYGRKARALEP